jgi:PIN domain nuclease of toxin-antitoxin system
LISAVSFAEIGATMLERGVTLELVETELHAAGITVVPFDERQALETARLRPLTKERGLSLADRACLALAAVSGRVAITSDQEWTKVTVPIEIKLFREPAGRKGPVEGNERV